MKVIFLRVEVPDEWLNDAGKVDPCDWVNAVLFGDTTEIEPKREWVDLTHQDWLNLYVMHHDQHGDSLSSNGYEEAIEAKIKEKNK